MHSKPKIELNFILHNKILLRIIYKKVKIKSLNTFSNYIKINKSINIFG